MLWLLMLVCSFGSGRFGFADLVGLLWVLLAAFLGLVFEWFCGVLQLWVV